MPDFDVAIIGDGFCSLLTAANLSRTEKEITGKKIIVIGRAQDPEKNWGLGVAYGQCHPQHLLNVPAARMGAFADKPEDFLQWLRANISIETLAKFVNDGRPLTHAFMPRVFYAQYLRGIAKSVLPKVKYRAGEVTDINYRDGLFSIAVGGEAITASYALLATGVPPIVVLKNDPELSDPWTTDFSIFKTSKNPVVILGTGLTMIDVVSSLAAQGFKGKIHAVSRRGLLPEMHAAKESDLKAMVPHFKPIKGTLAEKIAAFRRNAKACMSAKVPWQCYMDYVRPYTPELWQQLSAEEQNIFIRKILPYWNIHRHRQPRETAMMLMRLMQAGQLVIHKGKIDIPDASHIFNCRGPDYSLPSDSLLKPLLDKGLIALQENGMGISVDQTLSATGKAQRKLFIAGTLTAGNFLEATSVPELRIQCATIAANLN
jgi:uncharacterized NAD(P)/FAD-binding protein YdhS